MVRVAAIQGQGKRRAYLEAMIHLFEIHQ